MRLGEFFSKQSQMLAMQNKISTDSMHVMSIKSRREAVSMHVITIWTLIFLPGTFVAVSKISIMYRQIVSTNPSFPGRPFSVVAF